MRFYCSQSSRFPFDMFLMLRLKQTRQSYQYTMPVLDLSECVCERWAADTHFYSFQSTKSTKYLPTTDSAIETRLKTAFEFKLKNKCTSECQYLRNEIDSKAIQMRLDFPAKAPSLCTYVFIHTYLATRISTTACKTILTQVLQIVSKSHIVSCTVLLSFMPRQNCIIGRMLVLNYNKTIITFLKGYPPLIRIGFIMINIYNRFNNI